MALPPDDNQAFLREVDENLRRDQLQGFLVRWGRTIALVVGIGLALLGGFLWWRAYREAEAGRDSERLAQALNDIEAGQAARAGPALAALAQSPRTGYRAQARLTEAAAAAVRNDPKTAAASYAAIAADAALPQPVRDLALIRGTAIEFDTLDPAAVISRLKPLAIPGGAWFGSAGELTVAAELKRGRPDLAAPLAAAIARDALVPLPIRGRMVGVAVSLGQAVPPIVAGPR